MAYVLLKKDDIKKLIAEMLKKGYSTYGPVQRKDGVVLAEITGVNELSFDYTNFTLPAKRHFFPWSEPVFTAEGDTITQAPLPDDKMVLFGIRPCDARSFSFLDNVFIDDKAIDPFYQARRGNAIIITLACNNPLPSCFCTSVGGSPGGSEGTDVLAIDTGNALVLESYSEKGKELLKSYPQLFSTPGKADTMAAKESEADTKKKLKSIDISGAPKKLKGRFYEPVWDELALRCLGCGVCTFSCPTCYCFGLHDEKSGDISTRRRIHDACMFSSFTLEASGHNPRTNQNQRMRQRLMHKFLYTVENFGQIFCVGCGRCVKACPVNMDIRENITEVTG